MAGLAGGGRSNTFSGTPEAVTEENKYLDGERANAIETINSSIASEQGYKDNKQNCSNTIGDIITALNNLKNYYTTKDSSKISEIEARITSYGIKKQGIDNDILRAIGLIRELERIKQGLIMPLLMNKFRQFLMTLIILCSQECTALMK